MGKRDDGCAVMIFLGPIYLCLLVVEILVKLAGTSFIALLAIAWVVLGFPLYFLIELFGGDAKDGWDYKFILMKMLEDLWNTKLFKI